MMMIEDSDPDLRMDDHHQLDLDSHIPPKENLIMEFEVTFIVSIKEDDAREWAADEGEEDFHEDPIDTTEIMIVNEIEGDTEYTFNVTGQVHARYLKGT